MEYFPYRLRKGQKDMLNFIVRYRDVRNLCIQAPTGFGKTVIVLSALLSKGKKIVWVVRTGTETDRPIEELKIINDKKRANFSGLSFRGKRDMCLYINEKLKEKNYSYDDVSFFCERNRKNCPYYRNLENFTSILAEPIIYSEILDFSRKNSICPYYYQRKIAPYMDVLSINYNYIINQNMFWSLKKLVGYDDAYLVVDEAHNLQFASMNLNSDYISTNSIDRAINELETIDSGKRSEAWKFLNNLKIIFSRLQGRRKEVRIDFQELIDDIGNFREGIDILHELGLKVRNRMMKDGKRPSSSLYHISEFLENSEGLMGNRGIVFFLRREKSGFILERWDMRSAEVLKPIWDKFSSNIFMSGTLEPVEGFVEVIGLGDYSKFSINFKIDPDRIKSYILKGLSTRGERISKDMEKRYQTSLLRFIESFQDKNIAVFSASYRVQNVLLKLLPEKYMRKVLVEREGISGEESRQILESFKGKAYSDEKGILFASSSGRFSEGADFPGKELEAVFLAGIPFERITLKTEMYIKYFEEVYGEKGRYYAYVVPALRKASQALGRVIRSEDDSGIFVLADERFMVKEYFDLLPAYIRETAKIISYDELNF